MSARQKNPINRQNSIQKVGIPKNEDIQKIRQQMNMIPLPNQQQQVRMTSENRGGQMAHNPSIETLLAKKVIDQTQKIYQKTMTKGFLQQASQKAFIRHDSLTKLGTH